jgi:hypothetical protein
MQTMASLMKEHGWIGDERCGSTSLLFSRYPVTLSGVAESQGSGLLVKFLKSQNKGEV